MAREEERKIGKDQWSNSRDGTQTRSLQALQGWLRRRLFQDRAWPHTQQFQYNRCRSHGRQKNVPTKTGAGSNSDSVLVANVQVQALVQAHQRNKDFGGPEAAKAMVKVLKCEVPLPTDTAEDQRCSGSYDLEVYARQVLKRLDDVETQWTANLKQQRIFWEPQAKGLGGGIQQDLRLMEAQAKAEW